ncbi:hypothetical protein Tco_1038563, partial [Tanacetum coccineum]
FSNADYAGCKGTFKSTFGEAQFLEAVNHGSRICVSVRLLCPIPLDTNTDHVEKGTIELYFVKTDYQLANLFTKALPVDRFNYLVRRLGMRSLSPLELDRLAKSQ